MMGGCAVNAALSSAGLVLRNLDAFRFLVDWTSTRPWTAPLQPALEESFQLTLGCNLSSTGLHTAAAVRTEGFSRFNSNFNTHLCILAVQQMAPLWFMMLRLRRTTTTTCNCALVGKTQMSATNKWRVIYVSNKFVTRVNLLHSKLRAIYRHRNCCNILIITGWNHKSVYKQNENYCWLYVTVVGWYGM